MDNIYNTSYSAWKSEDNKEKASTEDICVKVCKKQACLIQACIARYGSEETRCKAAVELWNDCCARAKRAKHEDPAHY